MDYRPITPQDYGRFHRLAEAYYREGEDAATPQEEMDAFIRFLFEHVTAGEIRGCFAVLDGADAGFALYAADTPTFPFSQLPGYSTIVEIGLLPAYRGTGEGKALVAFLETCLRRNGITRCYVTAYGPAESFWSHCGYVRNGSTGTNGLPIMTKHI